MLIRNRLPSELPVAAVHAARNGAIISVESLETSGCDLRRQPQVSRVAMIRMIDTVSH